MAIPAVTSTTPSTSSGTNPAAALSSSDFLNLMITQLQQQDPLNPTDSNQLLTQMSQISNLQANTQMQNSLQSLTLQQSIAAGGNLIGKTVAGVDDNGNKTGGIVTSVAVQANKVYLQLDKGGQVAMGNITGVSAASASTPAISSQSVSDTAGSIGNIAPSIVNPQLAALLGSGASGYSSALSMLAGLGAK